MKLLVLTVVLEAFALPTTAADGTFYASNIIGGLRQYVYDVDGTTKLATASGAVQFLYQGAVVGNGIYGFVQPGTFSGGTIGLPNQSRARASITVEVWDKTTGATYEQAMISGHYLPAQTFTVNLGGVGAPPTPPSDLFGFTGGRLIVAPEPSVNYLMPLGLAGLLLVHRRRRLRSTAFPE